MKARVFQAVLLAGALSAAPAAACLSTPEQKAARFAALDTDGDGSLSLREYFMQSPLGGITAEKEREIFAGLDLDGDGSLSFEEFTAQLAQQRC